MVLNRQYKGFLPSGQKCYYGKGSLHQSCRVVSTTTKQGDNSAINFRKAKEIRRDFMLLWTCPNTRVLHETKILNCALTNGHIFWNVKPTWMCLKPNVFLMVSRGDSAGCMMKTQNLSSLSLKAFPMSRGGKSNITSWCRVSKNPNRLLQIVHFSDFYSVYILLFIYSPLSKPEMNQGAVPNQNTKILIISL